MSCAMAFQLLVVSDTHLRSGHQAASDNWEAVRRSIALSSAHAVVHLGDLTVDGANRPEDLTHAREELDRLDRPCFVLPGNHDIGDNPVPGGAANETVVDDGRRQRWLDLIGPDHWRLDREGWTLLGLNAQLFGSGLQAEETQWAWLADQISDIGLEQSLGLLIHKPLVAPADELAAAPSYRFVPPEPRRRLLDQLEGRPAPLVLSGHVHQHRILDIDGVRHVWAPSTWAVLPNRTQRPFGHKRVGHLRLTFDRQQPPSVDLVEAPGLMQQTIGDTVGNPYEASAEVVH